MHIALATASWVSPARSRSRLAREPVSSSSMALPAPAHRAQGSVLYTARLLRFRLGMSVVGIGNTCLIPARLSSPNFTKVL